eukprot:TRINITY_DN11033_c0_g1_i3.p1 TRINITY_DN11033_c0_g1~~TRINITY_DN11033_c0_g1_i3.p1  ORF type:complete len:344 (+),score=65.92 TRINITY_DN11033_c0_g1_i3:441-1472(+)
MHVPRQALRGVLLNNLPHHMISWSREFVRFEEKFQDIEVTFADGTRERCDLFIGADGIYSRARLQKLSTLFPIKYLGVIVVLGIAPCNHPLVHQKKIQTQGGDTRLYVMPFSNSDPSRRIMWQLSFPVACEQEALRLCSNPVTLAEEVMRRCKNWHSPVPEFLAATEKELIMGTTVYDSDPLSYPWWKQLEENSREYPLYKGKRNGEPFPRVVLLGDAAHPMSPFQAQGANQALLDAYSLANHLANHAQGRFILGNDTFRDFWIEMCSRSEKKIRNSRSRASFFHTREEFEQQLKFRGMHTEILSNLRRRNITASTPNLDDIVWEEISNFCATKQTVLDHSDQ